MVTISTEACYSQLLFDMKSYITGGIIDEQKIRLQMMADVINHKTVTHGY